MRRIGSALLESYMFWRSEDGQDLVEYSLLLGFIALAIIAILSAVRSDISTTWTLINNGFTSARSGS